jgi:hypothetical protein
MSYYDIDQPHSIQPYGYGTTPKVPSTSEVGMGFIIMGTIAALAIGGLWILTTPKKRK